MLLCFKIESYYKPQLYPHWSFSRKAEIFISRTLKFVLIVFQCLRSALSPGRAVWALVPVWMEGQDTWWSLLTALCAYRNLPCKEKQTVVVCVSCNFPKCSVYVYVSHCTDLLKTVILRLRPEINVCCLDGVKQQLCHSWSLHVDKMGLEECFRSPKPLSTHIHLSPIRELHQRKEYRVISDPNWYFQCIFYAIVSNCVASPLIVVPMDKVNCIRTVSQLLKI